MCNSFARRLATGAVAPALAAAAVLFAPAAHAQFALNPEFVVNQNTFGDQRGYRDERHAPRMVDQLTDGNRIVAYYDAAGVTHRVAILDDTDTAVTEIDLGPSSSFSASVAALSTGGFVAVFGDGFDCFAVIYNNAGTLIFPFFLVDAGGGADLQRYCDVAPLPGGDFVVTWADNGGGSYDILARRFNDAGAAVTPPDEFVVDGRPGTQNFPVIEPLSSGGYVITWVDGSGADGFSIGTFMRAYTAANTPVSGINQVNGISSANEWYHAAAPLSTGNIAFTYYYSGSAERFLRVLQPDGGEVVADTVLPNAGFSGDVIALSDGRFVSIHDDITADNIRLVEFSNGGALLSNTEVNQTTAGTQRIPRAGVFADDSFLFIYTDLSNAVDGSDDSVLARSFSATASNPFGPGLTVALGDADDDGTTNEIQSSFEWAEEVDFTQTRSGDLGLIVGAGANVAAGTNVQIQIDLSGPVEFSSQVDGADLVVGPDGVDTGTGFVVSTSGGLPPGATLTGTGAPGEQGVTFQVEAGVDEFAFGFQLPIAFTGCGAVDIAVEVRTDLGVLIQGGSGSLENAFTCGASAFDLVFAPDDDPASYIGTTTPSDTIVENENGFTTLGDALTGGFEGGSAAVLGNVLGQLNAAIASGPFSGRVIAVDLVANVPETAATADIDGASAFEVRFLDDANIDDVTYDGASCTDAGSNVWACDFPAGHFDATARDIAIDASAADIDTTGDGSPDALGVIARQTVSAGDALVAFDSTDHALIASERYAATAIDALNYTGVTCGVYDWVASSGNLVGRNDVFRVTGLPDGDVAFAMTLMNANDPAFNGDWHGTLSDRDGDRRINSTLMTAIAGEFGTADVLFHFFVDDDGDAAAPLGDAANPDAFFGSGVDCDRLIADGNGSIASYGDNANRSGVLDADLQRGTSSADAPVNN